MSVNASVVDPLCRCSGNAKIYKVRLLNMDQHSVAVVAHWCLVCVQDPQGLRWAFMLNQTNISGTFG